MFPGVKPGDRWCLCAQRWVQAQMNGAAPKLYLLATHEKTLQVTFGLFKKWLLILRHV